MQADSSFSAIAMTLTRYRHQRLMRYANAGRQQITCNRAVLTSRNYLRQVWEGYAIDPVCNFCLFVFKCVGIRRQ